ncbi:MAG: hypothetical protein ACRD06_04575 [Terriglobia bacterium]
MTNPYSRRQTSGVLCTLGIILVWASCAPAAQAAHRSPASAGNAAMAAAAGEPATIAASRAGDLATQSTGRDPFKLPPPPLPAGAKAAVERPLNLPPGVRGLMIGDLKLEGIVSENSGREMIAVVTNYTDRAYFLRNNERLYDGAVTRITPQEVFLTKRVRDHLGRESDRLVVKRLNPKAGDGQ